MTNQVNQAFEDFYNENKHLYTDTSPYGIMLTTFQAATKASESEINSLKEQVKELQSHLSSQSIEIANNDVTLESYAHKVAELQVDNKIMRDTLNKIALGHVYDADIIESAGDCLQRLSNSQSLAEHDNEVTAPYKKALEFAEHMAKSTEQFMIAINQLDEADQEEDEATVEIMQEKRGEHWRAVNSSIYEFRQRSDRALKAKP